MFKPKNNHERGQSLVEMAITLPILILILSGLFDLGRLYYTAVALEEAVAEAALYLAIDPDCADDTDPDGIIDATNRCTDPNNALYRAEHAGGAQEFNPDLAEWNIPYPENGWVGANTGMGNPFPDCSDSGNMTRIQLDIGIGCQVLIQVDYTYDFITPGIEAIANGVTDGNGLTLRFQATQIVVFE